MQGPMVIDTDGKRRRTWILRMVLNFSPKGYCEAVLRHGLQLDRPLVMCGETYVQRRIVYCHYPFWREHDFSGLGVTVEQRDDLIARLERRWESSGIPFPLPRLKGQSAGQGAATNA